MKTVNSVTLLGNVTRDPDSRTTPAGQALCLFGLATNRVWKDQKGERQTLAEYHNLVCWGALAEVAGQYVKKGKPLYIEGHLKTRAWNSETGMKLFRTEIVVDNLVLLGSREASASAEEHVLPLDEADPEIDDADVSVEQKEEVLAV